MQNLWVGAEVQSFASLEGKRKDITKFVVVVVDVVVSKTKKIRRILPWGETWTSASLGSWGLFLLRENMGGKFMATNLNS